MSAFLFACLVVCSFHVVESSHLRETSLTPLLSTFLEKGILSGNLQDIWTISGSQSQRKITEAIGAYMESRLLAKSTQVLSARTSFLDVAARAPVKGMSPRCLRFENYYFNQCAFGPPATNENDPMAVTPGH